MGLIWDLKTKIGNSNIYILRQLLLKQKVRKVLISKLDKEKHRRKHIPNNE